MDTINEETYKELRVRVRSNFKPYLDNLDKLIEREKSWTEQRDQMRSVILKNRKSPRIVKILFDYTTASTAVNIHILQYLKTVLKMMEEENYQSLFISLKLIEEYLHPILVHVGGRIGEVKFQLNTLKKEKNEVKLKVSKNIQQELKRWVREMEASRKVVKQYIG